MNDEIIDELFDPKKISNMETNDLTIDMAMLAAKCILKELRDPKKATSDYLSSVDGNFSWANTTEETHKNLIGTFATNNLADSPFASFTYQLDSCNIILGNNAAAVAQARMNGDFNRRVLGHKNDGTFHQLSDKLKHYLLSTALKSSERVRKEEHDTIEKQREHKRFKKEALELARLEKANQAYAQAVLLIQSYHSPEGWKTKLGAEREYNKIQSENLKLDAVKY